MLQKIIEIIAEIVYVKPKELNASSNIKDFGADSLDIVEIAWKLEDEFGVELDYNVFSKLNTIADVLAYIQSIINNNKVLTNQDDNEKTNETSNDEVDDKEDLKEDNGDEQLSIF